MAISTFKCKIFGLKCRLLQQNKYLAYMFGKYGDMFGKLQEIKLKLKEIKDRMEITTLEVSGAAGDIKMTINGNRKLKRLYISQALQNASKDELEGQLLVTFNKAVEEADKMNDAEMKKIAGGMLPPGIL